MYPAGTHLVPGGQPAVEVGRGAVAATGDVIDAMPPDCTRASSWALSCAAVSAPLAGAAITATTIAIRNTCFIASTLTSSHDRRPRSPEAGYFLARISQTEGLSRDWGCDGGRVFPRSFSDRGWMRGLGFEAGGNRGRRRGAVRGRRGGRLTPNFATVPSCPVLHPPRERGGGEPRRLPCGRVVWGPRRDRSSPQACNRAGRAVPMPALSSCDPAAAA